MFAHPIVDAAIQGFDHQGIAHLPRQEDKRNVVQEIADAGQDAETVEFLTAMGREDQIRRRLVVQFVRQRTFSVHPHGQDVEAALAERLHHPVEIVAAVFDDQNPQAGLRGARRGKRRRGIRVAGLGSVEVVFICDQIGGNGLVLGGENGRWGGTAFGIGS